MKQYKLKDFKVRGLTFGEHNEILDECGQIDPLTGEMTVKTGKMRFLTLKYGIVSPKLSDQQINNLPVPLALELYNRILKETNRPLQKSQE